MSYWAPLLLQGRDAKIRVDEAITTVLTFKKLVD